MTGTPGVLMDRDGTLIRDVGYLSRRDQIELLPMATAALRLLRQAGLKIIVVTNQSAVARGLLTESELKQIHEELKKGLAREEAYLDGIYYCPHHPWEGREPYRITCQCRKPNAGMAELAASELELDLVRSYVIGDQPTDMELAKKIGARGIRIDSQRTSRGMDSGIIEVGDLWEAAQWIVRDLGENRR